jgi:hypothetical protein
MGRQPFLTGKHEDRKDGRRIFDGIPKLTEFFNGKMGKG